MYQSQKVGVLVGDTVSDICCCPKRPKVHSSSASKAKGASMMATGEELFRDGPNKQKQPWTDVANVMPIWAILIYSQSKDPDMHRNNVRSENL
jgi:hypothetical protein